MVAGLWVISANSCFPISYFRSDKSGNGARPEFGFVPFAFSAKALGLRSRVPSRKVEKKDACGCEFGEKFFFRRFLGGKI